MPTQQVISLQRFQENYVVHPTIFLLMYLILVIIYAAVGFSSAGYDDELFNIRAIERFGSNVTAFTQSNDVHPPGSYLINWFLYDLFKQWKMVRLATAIFASGSLIYAIAAIKKRYGSSSGLVAFVLLGLNPALLMWCTGIRWYAYFVPVFIWICITPKSSSWWYWGKLFLGLVLLGYVGYAAFIVAPALFYLYWNNCHNTIRAKIKAIVVFGSLAALIYSYQLLVFLTVHLAGKESQVSSLTRNLLGFMIAQVGNQGVFPLSVGGIIAAMGSTGLFLLGIWNSIQQRKTSEFMIPYWLGVVLLIVSGLAGKFRNFMTLSPLQAMWFSTLEVDERKRKFFLLFIAFLGVGNFIGVFNVVTHQGTTKNSWNLPSKELLHELDVVNFSCANTTLVLTHDPALTLLLEGSRYPFVSPFGRELDSEKVLAGNYNCVVALKTYAGAFGDKKIQAMYQELARIKYSSVSEFYLGKDHNYKIKQRLDDRYPEFQIEAVVIREPSNLDQIKSWASGD